MTELVKKGFVACCFASVVGAIVAVFWLPKSNQPIVRPPSPNELIGSYAITSRSAEHMQQSGVYHVGNGKIVLLNGNVFECTGGSLEIFLAAPEEVNLATIIPEGSTGGEWEIVDNGANQEYLSLWHNTPGGRQWTHLWVGMIDGEFVLHPLIEPDELAAPLFRTHNEGEPAPR